MSAALAANSTKCNNFSYQVKYNVLVQDSYLTEEIGLNYMLSFE